MVPPRWLTGTRPGRTIAFKTQETVGGNDDDLKSGKARLILAEPSLLSDETGNLLPIEVGKQGICRSVRKLLVYLIGRPTNV